MKCQWTILVLAMITTTTASLEAQRVQHVSSDRSQVIHLQTALNHLTVIELGEPVIQVATGSQSFKVEWRENKVFVQPTENGAATNLFIWTASDRLNYELEPAGDVSGMDFALDQIPLVQPKPVSMPPPQPSTTEILLAGKPVRLVSAKPWHKEIEVTICDWYEKDGRVLIRYAVRNRGTRPYAFSTPQVYELKGVHYPQSLYALIGSQLGEQESARLRAKQQNPIAVLESHLQAEHLEPGQESLGIVAFRPPIGTEPTIFRFQFANDDRQQVTAFLVR
jgi:hypothetical protein